MTDVTITINTPTLLPGESFHVWYRLLPDGDFISLGTQTNASFQLPQLEPGDYELKVSFVTTDEVECPFILKKFNVPDTEPAPEKCECPLIGSVHVQKLCGTGGAIIKIEFEETGNAICQYEITYTEFNGANPKTVAYESLPGYMEFPIPYSGSSGNPYLTIKAKCCDGTEELCYPTFKISDVRTPECDCFPARITDSWLRYDFDESKFYLCFNFNGTLPATIVYTQLAPTTVDAGGDTLLTSGYHEIEVTPTYSPGSEGLIRYSFTITN